MAEVRERFGNLFASQAQTLVNTVNTVGVMGRGIALEFRYRFPEMFAEYERRCLDGSFRVGDLMLWKASEPWVLNFPTKADWKQPSRIEYIEAGLQKFASMYAVEGITSAAFPPLGASLGGLEWEQVRDTMHRLLSPLPQLAVEIVRYDSTASDHWFDVLCESTRGWSEADYRMELGLPKAQAAMLRLAMSSGEICQLSQLQAIKGFGEKSIERLYDFIRGRLSGMQGGLFG